MSGCLISDVKKPEADLRHEVIQMVRHHVGPVASFKDALLVRRLPKTRSGKVARGTISKMVAGKPFKVRVQAGLVLPISHIAKC